MKTRTLLISFAAAALAAGWYLFRPERLVIDERVSESFPAGTSPGGSTGGPTVLASGRFHSVAHETRGTATIYRLADGRTTLRLTDFETSNGPDVHVYLVAADDADDDDTVTRAGFLRVAALKGNIGEQNYDLPAGVDLAKYRAVTIWCRRFAVNFGTAPLETRGVRG